MRALYACGWKDDDRIKKLPVTPAEERATYHSKKAKASSVQQLRGITTIQNLKPKCFQLIKTRCFINESWKNV